MSLGASTSSDFTDVLPESPTNRTSVAGLDSIERMAAIAEPGLLEQPAQRVFNLLSELACQYLSVPVALVTIVTPEKQFFAGSFGLPEPWNSLRETPLTHSFCQHVTTRKEPLVIHDSRNHELVCRNLANSGSSVIAYLGVPMVSDDGTVIEDVGSSERDCAATCFLEPEV